MEGASFSPKPEPRLTRGVSLGFTHAPKSNPTVTPWVDPFRVATHNPPKWQGDCDRMLRHKCHPRRIRDKETSALVFLNKHTPPPPPAWWIWSITNSPFMYLGVFAVVHSEWPTTLPYPPSCPLTLVVRCNAKHTYSRASPTELCVAHCPASRFKIAA